MRRADDRRLRHPQGTLTVDIQGDSLFIHWINVTDKDPEGATRAIAETFEHYLDVIYG